MARELTRLALITLALPAAACGSATTAPPTADLTGQAQTQVAGTEAAGTQAAAEAEGTRVRGTEAAEEQEQTRAANAVATSTARVVRIAATKEAIRLEATSQAQPMADFVLDLYGQGYVTRSEGEYFSLPPFDETWAQIDWYQWTYTDYSPTDFIIRGHASWDSASDTANWFSSGCGFVFREKDEDNHYFAFLGLDGSAYMWRFVHGVFARLGSSYYGGLEVPAGEADIVLSVDGADFTFFVNGVAVHSRHDGALASGNLALTLSSGTNKGYGTRCRMTELELWVLE